MSDVLGLDRQMREAYHTLVRERACTAVQVSERLGIPRARAEEALDRLVAAGLVAPSPGEPRLLVPRDPRQSLGPLIAHRQASLIAAQQELIRSQEALAALTSVYAAYGRDSSSARPPELSRGQAAVQVRIEDMLESSRSTIMCFLVQGAGTIALGVQSHAIERAIGRGVAVRAVYAGDILDDDAIRAHARWLISAGGSARTAQSVPPAMLVVDRTTALVPADLSTTAAFVVHNRALTAALALLFDRVWGDARVVSGTPTRTSATPATDPAADVPSPQERDLLRLLGRGMTDASAARQLGVSLRTVRRMMAELMARLNARSRFEAGIRAAERGWIGSAPSPALRRTIRPRPTPPSAPAAINS
ncbi:helix-turn-helix transcriptional regulator [Actinopolymorpha alba]|uniref:helix-turn-helix transcriptional regulator n=1 Tax=Actinopolymorpha alba TaxID=533267 RepID=UPI00037839C1|nr:helix-turn-helix domain-containing protein [Actinopolymorpha alba]